MPKLMQPHLLTREQKLLAAEIGNLVSRTIIEATEDTDVGLAALSVASANIIHNVECEPGDWRALSAALAFNTDIMLDYLLTKGAH